MRLSKKGLTTIIVVLVLILGFQALKIDMLKSDVRTAEQHAQTFKERLEYFTSDEYLLDPYSLIEKK